MRRRGLPASKLLQRGLGGVGKFVQRCSWTKQLWRQSGSQDSLSVLRNELRDGKPLENSKENVIHRCTVRWSRDGIHQVAAVLWDGGLGAQGEGHAGEGVIQPRAKRHGLHGALGSSKQRAWLTWW